MVFNAYAFLELFTKIGLLANISRSQVKYRAGRYDSQEDNGDETMYTATMNNIDQWLRNPKHTPYCGWVTLAMAGFLACGSNIPALPSQFPSGFVKQSLTAYSCEGSQGFGLSDRPVLVPYCFP